MGRFAHTREWLALGRSHNGLVLDVGSGNSPHPRADVLVDRYVTRRTPHRFGGAAFLRDRPSVCSDIASLPFADNTFSFAIARHVIEHLDAAAVDAALSELSRVSREGYIETPSPLCELLMPDPNHSLFVWIEDGNLVVAPKLEEFPVPPIAKHLLEWRRCDRQWQRFMIEHESVFTTKLRWRDRVPYRIDGQTPWPQSGADSVAACRAAYGLSAPSGHPGMRAAVKHLIYKLMHLGK